MIIAALLLVIIIATAVAFQYKDDLFKPEQVKFEDYGTYEDRENPLFQYEDNYLVPFNNQLTFSDRKSELSNPSNPQCQSNSCSGEPYEVDSYGCQKYRQAYTAYNDNYNWREDQQACPGQCMNKQCCSYAPCWCFKCQPCRVSYTAYNYCGGATLGTCQGDDCFLQGSCSGNTYDDHPDKWATTIPIQTLKSFKEAHNNYTDGISIVGSSAGTCSGGPSTVHSATRYIDGLWDISLDSGNVAIGGGAKGSYETPKLIDGKIILKGSSSTYQNDNGDNSGTVNPTLKMKTITNFKGYNLKIVATCNGGTSYNGGSSGATRTVDPSCSVNIGTENINLPKNDRKAIEMFSSKLNSSNADIYIDGLPYKNVVFSNDIVNVEFIASGGSPQLEIEYFGYQVPFSCQRAPDELLGEQTIVGPREISIESFTYKPVKFCLAHPAILSSLSGGGSDTTAEPYDIFRSGGTMAINEDQALTVLYIFKNPGTIPYCEGKIDLATSNCIAPIHICSDGSVWDNDLKMCVPTQNTSCQYGVIDTATGECSYHINLHYVCDKGAENFKTGSCTYITPCDRYDIQIGDLCSRKPLSYVACIKETAFNSVSGWCETSLLSQEDCTKLAATYGTTSTFTDGICQIPVAQTLMSMCPDGVLYQPKEDVDYFECKYYKKPMDTTLIVTILIGLTIAGVLYLGYLLYTKRGRLGGRSYAKQCKAMYSNKEDIERCLRRLK